MTDRRLFVCIAMSVLIFIGCGAARTSVGESTTKLTVGNAGGAVVALCSPGRDVLVAAVEDSGLVRSTDGGAHWHAWETGVPTKYVVALAVNSRGDVFAGTLGSGLYRIKSGEQAWTRVDTSAPKNVLARVPAMAISPVDQTVFAATLEHGVYRSTNNGATWINDNVGLGIMNINAIACNASNTVYARCVGGGVFRRAAQWTEWLPVNDSLNDPYVTTIASQQDNTMLLGTRNGLVYVLEKSEQRVWIDITTNIPRYFVTVVASTPGGVILAGTKSGVYRFHEQRRQWTLADSSLESVNVRAMALADEGVCYIGAGTGEVMKIVVTD